MGDKILPFLVLPETHLRVINRKIVFLSEKQECIYRTMALLNRFLGVFLHLNPSFIILPNDRLFVMNS